MTEQVLLKYVSFDMMEGKEAFISDEIYHIPFNGEDLLYVIMSDVKDPIIATSDMITYCKNDGVIAINIDSYPELRIPVKDYRMVGYKLRNISVTYCYNGDKIVSMECLCIMPNDFQKENV